MTDRLAQLPAVHALVAEVSKLSTAPRWAIALASRRAIDAARSDLRAGGDGTIVRDAVARVAAGLAAPSLRRVVNATGVILHTNLGRAPLGAKAVTEVIEIARSYSNLELDLATGERGSRHDHLRTLLCDLTGAEDACVVNNNAAAVVLGLAALASDREVIVSRGELVEIGGSFRLPEIFALSRGVMVEVGTTNKTHLRDYEGALRPATGLLLKVHRANFAVVGFTSEVSIEQLATLGRANHVPVMVDVGSGMLVDASQQRAWGLPVEPTPAEAIAAGADLVAFSGDKLLGGPQAGILVGRKAAVERARKHPLMRALRPDKLALAALSATLAAYRNDSLEDVPVAHMLALSAEAIRRAAERLVAAFGELTTLVATVEPCTSTVGGGAMPTAELPSFAITLRGRKAGAIDAALRAATIPVVGRVAGDRVWLDCRTISIEDQAAVIAAIRSIDRAGTGRG